MDVKTPDPSAWTSGLLLTPSLQRQAAARAGPDNSDCAHAPQEPGIAPHTCAGRVGPGSPGGMVSPPQRMPNIVFGPGR